MPWEGFALERPFLPAPEACPSIKGHWLSSMGYFALLHAMDPIFGFPIRWQILMFPCGGEGSGEEEIRGGGRLVAFPCGPKARTPRALSPGFASLSAGLSRRGEAKMLDSCFRRNDTPLRSANVLQRSTVWSIVRGGKRLAYGAGRRARRTVIVTTSDEATYKLAPRNVGGLPVEPPAVENLLVAAPVSDCKANQGTQIDRISSARCRFPAPASTVTL